MPDWPADHVERWPLERLLPYARNARTHSDEQLAQVRRIAASIREWGWTMPVLVDEDGNLIVGHARTMAARQLGVTEVPVLVARGWTEEQKRSYALGRCCTEMVGPAVALPRPGRVGRRARRPAWRPGSCG